MVKETKAAIIYNDELEKYGFGEGHPFGGDRFITFFDFFKSRFEPFKNHFEIMRASPATHAALELVHTKEYIQKIKTASDGTVYSDIFRYVSMDNVSPVSGYIPHGIDEASRIVVGSALLAGELVMDGKYGKAIAFGGTHHAKPDYGEGFCFYNDVAVLARHLQKKYMLQRILILDTDAHAGNGTKVVFYDDPSVLLIDIHQDPHTVYPGTGFVKEIGSGKGEGFTVNVPLPPLAGHDAYNYVFDEVVFPIAREFEPEIIIRNGGSDPHYLDSLTRLGLTLSGLEMIGRNVRRLSDELTGGKSVDLILSGYNKTVLPYGWSALIAGLLDLDIDLSDFSESSAPPRDSKLDHTKAVVEELKTRLKDHWKCMS